MQKLSFNARAAVSAVRAKGSDPAECALCRAATATATREMQRACERGTFVVHLCAACAEVVDQNSRLRAEAKESR